MLIEQAVFTSAATSTGDGYHLVGTSPGITPQEAHELTIWGPSHDSLCESSTSASSVNFQRLSSGRFCVSKTMNAGSEYSRREGARVYTQYLVLDTESLARFANNPFAVVRAATAQGRMQPVEKVPGKLDPLRLAGKAVAADLGLLRELVVHPGLAPLTAFVDAALCSQRLVLIAPRDRQLWIAGLFNLLPIESRTEYTFTTGLKPSLRRPYRIVCVPSDSNELRRAGRDAVSTIFNVSKPRPKELQSAWANFLSKELGDHGIERLASRLESLSLSDKPNALDRLAHQLQADEQSFRGGSSDQELELPFPRLARVPDESNHERHSAPSGSSVSVVAGVPRRQDRIAVRNKTTMSSIPLASGWSPAGHANTLAVLEELDDAVFEALAGDHGALERLKRSWPAALAKLGVQPLSESREHYIRRALATWRQVQEGKTVSAPQRAQAAVEVICALYGE